MSVNSFNRYMAVNVRATWLPIKKLASQFIDPPSTGRIIAVASDHTAGNMPFGARKGAMARIVLGAAVELGFGHNRKRR